MINKIKILLYALLTSLAASALLIGFRSIVRQQEADTLQKNIAHEVLRFHVIAHSDSPKDQYVKYRVRDAVLSSLQSTLKNADSVEQAKKSLAPHMDSIQQTALQTLQKYGSTSSVSVSISSRYFPVKQYGEFTFPAGSYEALCIDIGDAKGQNWWCVLFPSLCFVDETTAVVPEKSKERLHNSLSEEEYRSLLSPSASFEPETEITDTADADDTTTKKPKLRFGLWDFFH